MKRYYLAKVFEKRAGKEKKTTKIFFEKLWRRKFFGNK